MRSFAYVFLNRDLLEELDGEDYVEFKGEWRPDEDTAWETFRLMLFGTEAGDFAPVTWEDVRRIIEQAEPE